MTPVTVGWRDSPGRTRPGPDTQMNGRLMPAPHSPAEGVVEHVSARRRALLQRSGTTSEQRAATQAHLLAAGKEVMGEKGIDGISVRDICSRAGYTRGAFYSNFTDMNDFVRTLAAAEWEQLSGSLEQALTEALSTRSNCQDGSDAATAAAVSALAHQVLLATPVTVQFYLFQHEFAGYLTRHPDVPGLQQAYAGFKAGLQRFLMSGLEAIGREPLLAPADLTDILTATVERSMREALIRGEDSEEALTALVDRALPTLLARLSRSRQTGEHGEE